TELPRTLSRQLRPSFPTPHSHQPLHRDHDSSESGMLSRLGDLLFYTIAEGQERIPIHKFTTALKATGLQTSDPRLRDCMNEMHRVVQESSSGGLLDRGLFRKCVSSNIVLLTQAFRKKFVIPDFEEFTGHVDRIFEDAKELTGGKVAAYIPQLAKSNPDLWGVSLCTVDGQRHSVGHTKIPFCLQSCVKPLTYAISIGTLGTDYVHKFVGKEPSGLRYNKLSLNEDGIPHNPMVNAGAIVVSSLIKMDCNKAEKFDFVLQYLNKMAANEYMGFSNATFQMFLREWTWVQHLGCGKRKELELGIGRIGAVMHHNRDSADSKGSPEAWVASQSCSSLGRGAGCLTPVLG
uniref:glutaminase n=1 Tax=Cebus imitator TaxID=2715852 RepID=A0A2K5RY05_CEBIM